MISQRTVFVVTFLACAGMMAYALYAEHVLELYPCPLCIFQRVAVIALGLVAGVAALHNPAGAGRWLYGLLALVAAGSGIAVAGRHVWLQNLPPDQVPACGGASLDYMLDTLPLGQVLRQVFTASGECAEISWQFLGLSMPTWVFIGMAALALWIVLGLVLAPRRRAAASPSAAAGT